MLKLGMLINYILCNDHFMNFEKHYDDIIKFKRSIDNCSLSINNDTTSKPKTARQLEMNNLNLLTMIDHLNYLKDMAEFEVHLFSELADIKVMSNMLDSMEHILQEMKSIVQQFIPYNTIEVFNLVHAMNAFEDKLSLSKTKFIDNLNEKKTELYDSSNIPMIMSDFEQVLNEQ